MEEDDESLGWQLYHRVKKELEDTKQELARTKAELNEVRAEVKTFVDFFMRSC